MIVEIVTLKFSRGPLRSRVRPNSWSPRWVSSRILQNPWSFPPVALPARVLSTKLNPRRRFLRLPSPTERSHNTRSTLPPEVRRETGPDSSTENLLPRRNNGGGGATTTTTSVPGRDVTPLPVPHFRTPSRSREPEDRVNPIKRTRHLPRRSLSSGSSRPL